MYVVCAPDSFKGSMTARQAAAVMASGVREVLEAATTVELPIADGGEGFTDAVAAALGARLVATEVTDQRGTRHVAAFALATGPQDDGTAPRLAVLDVAATSGLERVPAAERRIFEFDTRGLGQLVLAALDAGAERLVIGIGGSSTNEAGAGMLAVLGVRFLDAQGTELPPTPAGLRELARVDASGLDPRLGRVSVQVACDVTNPLLGPSGASAVYGPQKGAGPDEVPELDAILARLVGCCGEDAARVAELPGSGAAGGLGWALQFFLDARLRPGLDLVAELVGLDEQLGFADLLVTAEGSVDQQTPHGKAIQRICEHAERAGVPVIVFGGRVDLEPGRLPGRVVELVTITPPGTPLAQALRQGPQNLRRAVVETLRRWSSLQPHQAAGRSSDSNG